MDQSTKRATRSSGKPKEKELWTINVHISSRSLRGIGSGYAEPFSVSIKPSATEEELQELIYKKSPGYKVDVSEHDVTFGHFRNESAQPNRPPYTEQKRTAIL